MLATNKVDQGINNILGCLCFNYFIMMLCEKIIAIMCPQQCPSSGCLTCWCPCVTFGRIAEIVDKGSTCKFEIKLNATLLRLAFNNALSMMTCIYWGMQRVELVECFTQ